MRWLMIFIPDWKFLLVPVCSLVSLHHCSSQSSCTADCIEDKSDHCQESRMKKRNYEGCSSWTWSTSIGKHMGWVMLGPVQQLRSSSSTSSISAVRVMSWSVNWPQATNRKLRAWSWNPSSRWTWAEIWNVTNNMISTTAQFLLLILRVNCLMPIDMKPTNLADGSSFPKTDFLGSDMPSWNAWGKNLNMKTSTLTIFFSQRTNLEWAIIAAPQWGFSRLLHRPSRFLYLWASHLVLFR